MEIPHKETRNQFESALDWLHQWACSRSFGLGTRIPWDEQWLIEYLSDSTIYMAYHTVAHLLQGGSLDGSSPGPLGITAAQMTPAVWDHVFLDKELPAGATDIPPDHLALMRKEFNFWYPLDLHVSGKDLVSNHLTFFIYNHVAIFPESKWAKSIRANGHLLLNSGNFLSLRQSVNRYSADVSRLCLADASDSTEDANFVEDAANSLILRLHLQIEWMTEMCQPSFPGRTGPIEAFDDVFFESEINRAIALTDRAYASSLYREATKIGFYDLQAARDRYREVTQEQGMHKGLVARFIEAQVLLLAPITPHFSEHIWSNVLKKDKSVMHARWPESGPVNEVVLAGGRYFDKAIHEFRLVQMAQRNPKKGPKPAGGLEKAKIYVAATYPDWQEVAITLLTKNFDEVTGTFNKEAVISEAKANAVMKKNMQKGMSFVAKVMEDTVLKGKDALKLELPFGETEILTSYLPYLTKSLKLTHVEIFPHTADPFGASALPAEPVMFFYD